jgi:glycosyltransferase involved in cell wall biosynthesis
MVETTPRIAVLIPCYNEEAAIGKVVDDFRRQLPEAVIYVFDNRCTDKTAPIAREHGATVIHEPRQGKGFVVESMFDRIDADYYVMVDGDDTYPADKVHELLAPVTTGRADMTVGLRVAQDVGKAYRPLHVLGNQLVRGLINAIFGCKLTDILSGYRAFNRKVVARVPIVSAGFEVETEMTIHALYYQLLIVEVPVPYGARPEGSASKLRTFRDGARVLWKLFNLSRSFKPLTFFGAVALLLFLLGWLAGIPPLHDFFVGGQVKHLGMAILATGLMLLSAGSFFLGMILHAVNWRFKELHNVLARGRGRSDAIDQP